MTVKEYNITVEQYADNIYRFILKNIRDVDKAKDLVQDTFEKVWLKREDVSYAKIKSYLFSTAYHATIDAIRREKFHASWDQASDISYVTNNTYSDVSAVLNKALDQLPSDQKSVMLLRDYEGYSYKEIAEITQLSESQVKVYIFRARLFMKNYIGKIETLV